MSSRSFVAATIVALATILSARASQGPADEACTREVIPHVAASRPELTRLFARPDREAHVIETRTGISAPMGAPEVVLARVGPDGKLILACVDNETEARRFFETSAENLAKVKEK
jgi:hypothetical protein